MNDLTLEAKTVERERVEEVGKRDPRHVPPLVNKPGKLMWINKASLHIDRRYQRAIEKRAVHRIANAWNWVACGCLSVSRRKMEDDHYFIFDGQHRWEAAKLVPAVSALPCIVYELDTAAEEAAGFIATNTERRILKRVEQFNGLLMIRDPIAMKIDQLCREGGRTVNRHSGPITFSAVSAIARNLQDDEGSMSRVWPVVIDCCQGRSIVGRYLDALWSTERRMPSGQSLTDSRWHDRLRKIGVEPMLVALRTAYLYQGKINQRVSAETVAGQINRSLRKGNQLKLKAERFVRPPPDQRVIQ